MKQFSLDNINAKAPYEVSIDGKQFVFETQYGLHYEIRFFEEQPIGGCETWQFSFTKAEDTAAQVQAVGPARPLHHPIGQHHH
jgi:hypothetical protein